MSGLRAEVDSWARLLKRKVIVLSLAIRHPRTPLIATVVGGLTVAYAVAPIDLIPDFIPILGYLDDILLVPLGVYLFMKLVPPDVWAECEERATAQGLEKLPKVWSRTCSAILPGSTYYDFQLNFVLALAVA